MFFTSKGVAAIPLVSQEEHTGSFKNPVTLKQNFEFIINQITDLKEPCLDLFMSEHFIMTEDYFYPLGDSNLPLKEATSKDSVFTNKWEFSRENISSIHTTEKDI